MKKMRTYHRHIGAALLLAMATLSACVSEVIATSERTVSATFDELDTRVSLWPHEQSLDLTPAWQQEDMIRVFLRDGGTYHDLSSVPVRSISGDGKGCLFSYTIPGDMSGSEGLREICFTDAANPVLEDGRIYYGASLVRAPLERFRAPVLLDHPVAEGKDAKFRHYMTYELLHVKNETGADITFSHCGFVSERKWYRESGAYCLDTGDFTEGSSAAVPAAGRSEALTIPAGGTGIVISAYVPSGERIAEAQLLADIDGERIVSYNRKSSSAELRTGRAYHMYASWDGSKLTFRNGAFEETGDGQAEMHVGVPVDLGLSVKWAGWNVGASAPEIFGNHYAWGEYLEKSTYGWENYSLCEGTNRSLTKYGLDASFGKVDGKEVLEPMNDAATVNWNGSWRMPTREEWQELQDNCDWVWADRNGVSGYLVTSRVEGFTDQSIFLPREGLGCAYWSSTLHSSSYRAHALIMTYTPVNHFYFSVGERKDWGLVRPVQDKKAVPVISVSEKTVSFEDVTAGMTATRTLEIVNNGDTVLEISSVDCPEGFSGSCASTSIEPGGGTELRVSFTPMGGDLYEGVMYIRSNACNGVQRVSLWGNARHPEVSVARMVDLGLSVMWADWNVGASAPEVFGDRYAWGDVDIRQQFGWEHYLWCEGTDRTLTKYNTLAGWGVKDNRSELELSDDVAHVLWGGEWRMPLQAEWLELRDSCDWTWTDRNGVGGYLVTSRVEGYEDKSIFLPREGLGCRYWSSSLNLNNPARAHSLLFHYSPRDYFTFEYAGRDEGGYIRPVHGARANPVIEVSEKVVTFEDVAAGHTASKPVVVRNAGGAPLDISSIVCPEGFDADRFSMRLEPGEEKEVVVSFTPESDGVHEGEMFIHSNASNGVQRVSLWGNARHSEVSVARMVDLGLSVMWADWNVGASAPEVFGDRYAWGDVDIRQQFEWEDYLWCEGTDRTLTKYSTIAGWGVKDNRSELELSDDVAHVLWGGDWRMPRRAEWLELRDSCVWTWTARNGVSGYLVTSRVEGYEDKSIFLPREGLGCRYWSSSLDLNNPARAYSLLFHYSPRDYFVFEYAARNEGGYIRPVNGARVNPVISVSTKALAFDDVAAGGYLQKHFQITNDGRSDLTVSSIDCPEGFRVDWSMGVLSPGESRRVALRFTPTGPDTYEGAVLIHSDATNGVQRIVVTGNARKPDAAVADYVDLGLSVKWARWNVGASEDSQPGDKFAWGETESRSLFTWEGYSLCEGTDRTLTRYCTVSAYGRKDNKALLDLTDDAAHMNWGGDWRMPTHEEWEELRDNCDWTWTSRNGVGGFLVRSRVEGYTDKSIFLPREGYGCMYWSSSLNMNYPSVSYSVQFSYTPRDHFVFSQNARCEGGFVRPVNDYNFLARKSAARQSGEE